ncbi:MAG: HEPN domain-containing protein [Methanospirillum sp.]
MDETAEKKTYSGIWWIPSEADRVVHGTLTLEPFRLSTLRVTGLEETGNLHLDENPDCRIIVGRAEGTDFTLIDVTSPSIPQSMEKLMVSTTFDVGTVFADAKWDKRKDVAFKELYIDFRRLTSWSKYEPFSWSTGDFESFTVSTKRSEILFEDDSLSIELSDWTGCWESHFPTEVYMKKRSTIIFRSDTEQQFEAFFPYIEQMQSFLSMCLGIGVFPETILGMSSARMIKSSKTGAPVSFPIKINTVHFRRYGADQLPNVTIPKFPISYDDIQGQTQTLLGKWIEQKDTFKDPRMLFLSTLFSPQMYPEHKFLSCAQCIEVYHRVSSKYEQTLHKPDEYAHDLVTVGHALEGTSMKKTRQKEFVKKLEHGNTPSFENRIDQILKRHDDVAPLIRRSFRRFAATVVGNRNYLTHYDPKPGFIPATPDELEILTKSLGRLFYICMIDELGLSAEFKSNVLHELISWDLPS